MRLELSNDLSISDFHHLIVAPSGAGKTRLTALMMCVLAKELYESNIKDAYTHLLIIDPKRASLYSTRYSAPFEGAETYAHDVPGAVRLLQKFYNEIERRSELLDNKNLPFDSDFRSLNLAPIYLIFDEFIDCIENSRNEDKKLANEIQTLLVRCITKGRQLGCFVWITMIRADASYLPGAIRSTMTKILLCDKGKEPDSDGARMLFNTADLPKPTSNMRFYGYMMGESGSPKLFLTPTLGESVDVRQVLKKYLN